MDSSDPPNHAITWRVMATIMGLEVIACVGITVAWLLGPFVDIIENFYNVPDCDFSCFRRVSNQLAVIKIVCAILYSASAASALFALYGFLAGQYKPVKPHCVMSIVRFVGTMVITCYNFSLSYGYHPIFIANVVVVLVSSFLNGAAIYIAVIGYILERKRNFFEMNTASDALVRPFSGHDASCCTFTPAAERFRRPPSPPPSPVVGEGEFFHRRRTATNLRGVGPYDHET